MAADFEDGLGTQEVTGRRTWVAIKLVRDSLVCLTYVPYATA